MVKFHKLLEKFQFRPVIPGGAGGVMAHPIFATSVNPNSTRGHPRVFRPSNGPAIQNLIFFWNLLILILELNHLYYVMVFCMVCVNFLKFALNQYLEVNFLFGTYLSCIWNLPCEVSYTKGKKINLQLFKQYYCEIQN